MSPDLSFVEIENDEGESIRIGEWTQFTDGSKFWSIRITPEDIINESTN